MVPERVRHARQEMESWLVPRVDETEAFLADDTKIVKDGELPSVYTAIKIAIENEKAKDSSSAGPITSAGERLVRASEILDHMGQLQPSKDD